VGDFWRWQPHPEVWLLLAGVVLSYVYALRVIGPKVVPAGQPTATRTQLLAFVAAVGVLWLAADWPMHDIGEEYLYSVHMFQHFLLSLVLPPLVLIATPEWLARLVVGKGRLGAAFYRLARPIPAAVLFNALALLLHWQVIVNASVENGLLHYVLHVGVVTFGLLLWIPVCGPFPELRLSPLAQMLYLFVTSIVPTVPAAWLTFAEGAVYSAYDIPARLWDISVTTDQQVAGLFMKLGAGGYLWVIIAVRFFQWASSEARNEGEPLTFDQVQAEFDRHPAPR
jgi:putative membrane protein